MTYTFTNKYVQSQCGTVIPLKMIETMRRTDYENTEESTIAKIKGDICVKCITLSGKEYTVSVLDIIRRYPNLWNETEIKEVANSIEARWMHCVYGG